MWILRRFKVYNYNERLVMTNCFSKSDALALTFPVFVNASPPGNDNVTEDTYPHWPANHYSGASSTLTGGTYTQTGHKRIAFVWANRKNYGSATFNKKPNPLPMSAIYVNGNECRTTFTTVGLANAATRIQIRQLLGIDYSSILLDHPTLGTPVPFTTWFESTDTERAALFPDVFSHTQGGVTTNYAVSTDKVMLLPPMVLSKLDGVELDYEVQDLRSESTTDSFTGLIANDIQSVDKEAMLLVNPYNAQGAAWSGITEANLAVFLAEWDWLTMWLHSDNPAGTVEAAYNEQRDMLPATMTDAEWAKIILRFELGLEDGPDPGTTIEDAQFVRDKLTESGNQHPSGVQFHRSQAPAGGACTSLNNQKIELICFG